ncbi:MAG: thiol-disulfide oxidoreductase DCC family protein [Gemmatimonadaceae bacterium]|nr:thiol-disulfide oxidoreductase DCC family protein [Chitinophagaceae bacterium]
MKTFRKSSTISNKNHLNSVVLFDGLCNLCSNSVQFVIKRDDNKIFKFASLQSPFAENALRSVTTPGGGLKSIVLIENGEVYTKSTAALKVFSQLPGYKWMKSLLIFPRFIRDAVYDLIARNRYSWFGKKDACWIPTEELKSRFIQ